MTPSTRNPGDDVRSALELGERKSAASANLYANLGSSLNWQTRRPQDQTSPAPVDSVPSSPELRRLIQLERELFTNLSERVDRERKLELAIKADPQLRAQLRHERDRAEALKQRALDAMLRNELARKEIEDLKAELETLHRDRARLEQEVDFYRSSAQAWRDEVGVQTEIAEFLRQENQKLQRQSPRPSSPSKSPARALKKLLRL